MVVGLAAVFGRTAVPPLNAAEAPAGEQAVERVRALDPADAPCHDTER
jgi:hypothetical protein